MAEALLRRCRGSVRARARQPVWLAKMARVGSRISGVGIGDGVCGLRLRRCDGAAGAHGPGLSPVPLPRVRQAVQRAQRRVAELYAVPLGRDRPGGPVAPPLSPNTNGAGL